MKLRSTPENVVTADILRKTSHLVDWLRNANGNAQLASGGRIRYGLGGILGSADWIGIVRATGRLFALEVKAKGKKPNHGMIDALISRSEYCPDGCKHLQCRLCHQELFLRRVRASGGIGIFADCVEDVLRALEEAT